MDPQEVPHVCRICQSDNQQQEPLANFCHCIGSMQYVHRECLIEWMHHSRRTRCEFCQAPYTVGQTLAGVLRNIVGYLRMIKFCFHIIMVTLLWFGGVPLIMCRIYQNRFDMSFKTLLSSAYNISLSRDFWLSVDTSEDIVFGFRIITFSFILFVALMSMVYLFVHGGEPGWLIYGRVAKINTEQMDKDILKTFFMICRVVENAPMNQIFGYDGSYRFLATMFGVIFVNTILLLAFTVYPHKLGAMLITQMTLQDEVAALYFKNALTIVCGYCFIALCVPIMYTLVTVIKHKLLGRIFGYYYVFLKIMSLYAIRYGVMPLAFGWILDVSSLSVYNRSYKDRIDNLCMAPNVSIVIHWIVGTVYMHNYFKFLKVARTVVRPGVLKFDNEELLQDFVFDSMTCNVQRSIVSLVKFGTVGFIVSWMPYQIFKSIWPTFLTEYESRHTIFAAIELIFLHAVLPALVGQLKTNWVKSCMSVWCVNVSRLLGIKSYLIGEKRTLLRYPLLMTYHVPAQFEPMYLNMYRQSQLQEPQPYVRPSYLLIRQIALLILLVLTLVMISLFTTIMIELPGRVAIAYWMKPSSTNPQALQIIKLFYSWSKMFTTFVYWLMARSVYYLVKLKTDGFTFRQRFNVCLKISFQIILIIASVRLTKSLILQSIRL